MILFDREIINRLEKIESHVKIQDERDKEFSILSAEIASGIKNMTENLERHMRDENDKAERNTHKLDQISNKLNDIERDLISIPKDTDLKIQSSQEEIREYMASHYATRADLNAGLNAIRANAKTIWVVISGVLASVAWAASIIMDYVS